MKKLLFVLAVTLAACGGGTKSSPVATDSTKVDSTKVDTTKMIDTIISIKSVK
jgi:hypothetical protein